MAKQKPIRKPPVRTSEVVTGPNYPTEDIIWWREAVEGLVIAIVLALLIRGFEAEAFVIPTGSMAPTLQGRHKDIVCTQCQHHYRAGASLDNELAKGRVVTTTCPMCFYPMQIEDRSARDISFTGDRILVNKFAYDFGREPERFDVIVFKNPGNAKQNYIKRLCGLPGETIRLYRGDVYFKKDGEQEFQIARKPPNKLRTLFQLVHDTEHIPAVLDEVGLPPRWQVQPSSQAWSTPDQNRSFTLRPADQDSWIRYRHIAADALDWYDIEQGEAAVTDLSDRRGQLITDFYAYNAFIQRLEADPDLADRLRGKFYTGDHDHLNRSIGKNWVGDLALEVDTEITSDGGELFLDLVEGGWHFRATIDIETGRATLSINDGSHSFTEATTVSAQTKIRGPGKYRLFFSNADDQLRLCVNDQQAQFDGPSTYRREESYSFQSKLRPVYNGPEDPGDLAPVGVGGRNAAVNVDRLRVYRDVYYVAVDNRSPLSGDYVLPRWQDPRHWLERIEEALHNPETWATTQLFDELRCVEFTLEDKENDAEDQFFPMGDNSPQSEDARIWRGVEKYVERQYLIGEAIVIYWPHPWHASVPIINRTLPVLPNLSRMGVIR